MFGNFVIIGRFKYYMPQKIYIIETQEEVNARHEGISIGKEKGYKEGFQAAFSIFLIIFITYLFFTVDNIAYLHEVRQKLGRQLMTKFPDKMDMIVKILPDTIPKPKLTQENPTV